METQLLFNGNSTSLQCQLDFRHCKFTRQTRNGNSTSLQWKLNFLPLQLDFRRCESTRRNRNGNSTSFQWKLHFFPMATRISVLASLQGELAMETRLLYNVNSTFGTGS